MSRTLRKVELSNQYSRCLRKPKTSKEIKDLKQILLENKLDSFKLSKVNRIHKRLLNLPVYWDDLPISALKELVKK
jgi:hypothetical protein